MARRKTPQWLALTIAATAVAAASYKLYEAYQSKKSSEVRHQPRRRRARLVAVALLPAVVGAGLPLDEYFQLHDDVTFIVVPGVAEADLPSALLDNYRCLRCSSAEGYHQLLKNVKPDLLLECQDVGFEAPADMLRFVKETVRFEGSETHAVLTDVLGQ